MAEENSSEPVTKEQPSEIKPGGELSESDLDKASGGNTLISGVTETINGGTSQPTAPGTALPGGLIGVL